MAVGAASISFVSATDDTLTINVSSLGTSAIAADIYYGLHSSGATQFFSRVIATGNVVITGLTEGATYLVLAISSDEILITTSATLPAGQEGQPYSETLTAVGGDGDNTWSLADGDTLPGGLTLDADTGEISGTPTEDGTFTFTVVVTDGDGHTGQKEFTLVLAAQPTAEIVLLGSAVIDAAELNMTTQLLWWDGSNFYGVAHQSGATAKYVWQINKTNGALSNRVDLADVTAIIGGIVTDYGDAYYADATAKWLMNPRASSFSSAETRLLSINPATGVLAQLANGAIVAGSAIAGAVKVGSTLYAIWHDGATFDYKFGTISEVTGNVLSTIATLSINQVGPDTLVGSRGLVYDGTHFIYLGQNGPTTYVVKLNVDGSVHKTYAITAGPGYGAALSWDGTDLYMLGAGYNEAGGTKYDWLRIDLSEA